MRLNREAAVRASFAEQAMWCERLGSPFTARLCATLGRRLDRSSGIGATVLDWAGDASPGSDALALRLCGGLHNLVRNGEAPELEPLYPPAPLPEEGSLSAAVGAVLERKSAELEQWIGSPPQTNEVGRSALLMSGLLAAAKRFRLPFRLFELGASAGLNLNLDRYGYDLGGTRAGDPGSPLQIRPEWTGAAPPSAEVRIVARAGVDLSPIDPAEDGDRLLAYIWPDQEQRLRQTETAIELAAAHPPAVAQGDAAKWIEQILDPAPEPGLIRTVMHSVSFQYFPAGNQDRLTRHLEKAGAEANAGAPLAWLRFEKLPEDPDYSLRLRTWPGDDHLLAWAHPHGRWVRWLGQDVS